LVELRHVTQTALSYQDRTGNLQIHLLFLLLGCGHSKRERASGRLFGALHTGDRTDSDSDEADFGLVPGFVSGEHQRLTHEVVYLVELLLLIGGGTLVLRLKVGLVLFIVVFAALLHHVFLGNLFFFFESGQEGFPLADSLLQELLKALLLDEDEVLIRGGLFMNNDEVAL